MWIVQSTLIMIRTYEITFNRSRIFVILDKMALEYTLGL